MPEATSNQEEDKKLDEGAADQNTEIIPAADSVLDVDFSNELREPHWSVVSFENCIAKNLTYDEAAQKLQDFSAQGTSGLCIITDEAAARISDEAL